MRTIGLLGGMSWVSSAEYYRLVNERVRDTLGDMHSARCVLYSVDFAEIEELQAQDRWPEAGALLADAARSVQAAGADLLVLCTNTMHKVADRIQAAVDIPLLHVVDVTVDAIRAEGMHTVGLLGTGYTMSQRFHRDRFADLGIDMIVPADADQDLVHRVIFDELVKDRFTDESRHAVAGVIERLGTAGAEGVVLGCTELELLVTAPDSALPLFPTTRIHAYAAVDRALAD